MFFAFKNCQASSFALKLSGVLIVSILMVGFIGCSGSERETSGLYSEEGASPDLGQESTAEVSPDGNRKASSEDAPLPEAPVKPVNYTAKEREVVLRYVEWGEDDPENMKQASQLLERARQRATSQRVMEDYLLLAAHHWNSGDKDQVVQFANQGVTAVSDNLRIKANMFIYLGYTYEDKSPTMALSYFKQAAKLDPDFYKGYYERGRTEYMKKNFPAAKEQLALALNKNPGNAQIYGMLGQMFYGMDLYAKAAESYEKAIALSPQTAWLLVKLGDTYYFGLKEREKGGDLYQKAVMENVSDSEAHFGLAVYHRSKNKYTDAEIHLNKAISLDYKNPKYQRELDDLNAEKKEMAEGIEKYLKAIKENPTDPHSVVSLARYYLRWQKFDEAEKHFIKALDIARKHPETIPSDKNNEEETGDQIISRVPEFATMLGWFYFNDKKPDKALEAFQTALKADGKYNDAMYGLGRVFENLGQYDQAATQYNLVITADAEYQEAADRLAAMEKSGKLTPVVAVEQETASPAIQKSANQKKP